MQIDWTVKITDIVTIFAIVIGPILAVQITEHLRKSGEARNRKILIFRTLMATRSASLSSTHIESLNLVEIEFHSSNPSERKVVDCWRLYMAHLNDRTYPKDSWPARRADLLLDLLYEMSSVLGYSYDKAQIKSAAYYPEAYQTAENDQFEIRKLWLEVLNGKRSLPMHIGTIAAPNDDLAQPTTIAAKEKCY